MTIAAAASELAEGYEALRAEALGELPAVTPRGQAVLAGAGMPAWMSALAPSERPTPTATGHPGQAGRGGQGEELVRLLAEMVLSSRARCHP